MPAIQQARLTMGGKVQAGGREYAPFPCAARGTLPPPRQRGRGCARPRRHARQLGGHGRRRGRRDALGDAGRLGGGARGVGRRRRPALPLSGRLPLPRRCATTWAPLRSPSSSSACSASPRPSRCPCGACSRPRLSAERPAAIRAFALPLHPALREVAVEPHLGGLPAASGVVGTEFGPVGVAWAVSGGPWSPPWPRAVSLEVNASVVAGAAAGAAAAGASASSLALRVALPLDDPETPPPPSAAALAAFCLDSTPAGGQTLTVNVTAALQAGTLSLDASHRFLRLVWNATPSPAVHKGGSGSASPGWLGRTSAPAGVAPGSVSGLQLRLYAPAGGAPCGAAF